MTEPKTIRGYISLIRKIEKWSPSTLKGYDKLSTMDIEMLQYLDGEISNCINEVEAYKEKEYVELLD